MQAIFGFFFHLYWCVYVSVSIYVVCMHLHTGACATVHVDVRSVVQVVPCWFWGPDFGYQAYMTSAFTPVSFLAGPISAVFYFRFIARLLHGLQISQYFNAHTLNLNDWFCSNH